MNNFLNKNEYRLATTSRIAAARFCDLLFVSIIPLLLDLTSQQWHWPPGWVAFFLVMVTLALITSYFVVVPYYWRGKTLAKWMWRLQLIAQTGQLLWKHLWMRECFLTYIPWFVILLANLTVSLVLQTSFPQTVTAQHWSWSIVVLRLAALFYLMWYCGLWFGIAFDANRQFFVDHYFNLYLVRLKPKHPPIKRAQRTTSTHIHLGDHEPGMVQWQETEVAVSSDTNHE